MVSKYPQIRESILCKEEIPEIIPKIVVKFDIIQFT